LNGTGLGNSVGSGYIGLEFSDVYSALGEVTMIEALDQLMPGLTGTLLTRRAGDTLRHRNSCGIYAKKVIPGSPVIELAFKTEDRRDRGGCLPGCHRSHPSYPNLGIESVG